VGRWQDNGGVRPHRHDHPIYKRLSLFSVAGTSNSVGPSLPPHLDLNLSEKLELSVQILIQWSL
jgi:hypothetical protein